jgi:Transposase DDE domain group 1
MLYQDVHCRRGCAENHIKSWKTHFAADRTSCSKVTANQFRLFLHAGAYWLLWALRTAMPKRSAWRAAQFDTLRLRLIKIAARVVETKTQIRLHLPTACPYQAILRTERWLHNFGRRGKWDFCLTRGMLVPANQEQP